MKKLTLAQIIAMSQLPTQVMELENQIKEVQNEILKLQNKKIILDKALAKAKENYAATK